MKIGIIKWVKKHMQSEIGFYIALAIILIFCWLLVGWLPINTGLKPNLQANIIGVFFTILVIGRLLRVWYPPPAKTMSKFLIPKLNHCLFDYVRHLGFLLEYRFDNKGFKGISSIDLSTYGTFMKNNIGALKYHLEKKKDTIYTAEKLKDMNRMFRVFHDKVDQFIIRYGNHLDDIVLNLLYEIRHICDYQVFYTTIPNLVKTEENKNIEMGNNISNEPMKKVLNMVEEIILKIDQGNVLKKEPLPI